MGKENTEKSGAEPEVIDMDQKWLDILNELEWKEPNVDPEKEPTKEPVKGANAKEPSKEDVKKEAWKELDTPKEDELKIPRSRLNKEIEKKNAVQSKYDKLLEKIKTEEDRVNSLSDDEKEEQSNLQKLWMDTKLSKLQDKLEDMEDDMSDKDSQIKELQETINKAETWSLSKRIAELTAEMDWKDWLPKFDIKELLEFSKEKNFLPKDPIELYNFKYQAEIYAKKYEKAGTEVDKGNKGNFEPTKRNPTFANGDEDFEASAKEILDSIGQTT